MDILIVDDQPAFLKTTAYAVRTMGHRPFTAENIQSAWHVLRNEPIDAMFLDVNLGAERGLDLLSEMTAQKIPTRVIVFTAQSSIALAVEAMRRGAYDYISKPFVPDDIKQKLFLLKQDRETHTRIRTVEEQVRTDQPRLLMDSSEPAMDRALAMAFRAAPSAAMLLLLGPSGTGKSVLARAIHQRGSRQAGPFITINCASLSRDLLESELFGHTRGAFTGAIKETWGKVAAAEGGTLFLDEVGEVPAESQPKLLRLLQEREYERVGETRTRRANIRVISATNRNLSKAVAEGRFREDLYYRLKVITITMPALVDRPGDLRSLAENFLRFFAAANGRSNLQFAPAAMAALHAYVWPGNLREMRNVIERAVILATGDTITPADLPDEFRTASETTLRPGQFVTLEQLELEHIRQVVSKAVTLDRAASILGIDTATLYRKRRRSGMSSPARTREVCVPLAS